MAPSIRDPLKSLPVGELDELSTLYARVFASRRIGERYAPSADARRAPDVVVFGIVVEHDAPRAGCYALIALARPMQFGDGGREHPTVLVGDPAVGRLGAVHAGENHCHYLRQPDGADIGHRNDGGVDGSAIFLFDL